MAPQASSQWPDGSAQATTISNSVAKAAGSELTGATTATALTSVAKQAVPDRLTDFDLAQPGKVIDPSTAPILDFAERVASHLSPLGADAVIARGANSVTLVGIPGADLAAGEMLV